jgi:hypothetical protein
MLFAHRKRRPASSRREAEGKAGMKKCGAQNPLTALDGALSCPYLDAEIGRLDDGRVSPSGAAAAV